MRCDYVLVCLSNNASLKQAENLRVIVKSFNAPEHEQLKPNVV